MQFINFTIQDYVSSTIKPAHSCTLYTGQDYIHYLLMGKWDDPLLEEFEDNKEVIIIRISKNRQHNGQTKKVQKDEQRSTKPTHKTKDRVTRTALISGGAPEG